MTKSERIRDLLALGLSVKAIHDIVGGPVGTVYKIVWRARGGHEHEKACHERWRRRNSIRPRKEADAERRNAANLRNRKRDQIIRKHYGKRPVHEIAAMLGETRNAVIGRAHRIGVSA